MRPPTPPWTRTRTPLTMSRTKAVSDHHDHRHNPYHHHRPSITQSGTIAAAYYTHESLLPQSQKLTLKPFTGEAEEAEDNLDEIDLNNIVEGGRRTRGRVIDWAKAAQENPADDDDDEDEEDFEPESKDNDDDKMDED
ncbi:histone chaperone domain CHZ-domain-containing protein [Microdochium trichocladiopsis]|uniref:Histone chaperone domain CHZ-domain-containing protein n=1 Tax=Microdochium trichocladiopsis TaxID=1682393 RepID=A0A9P8YHA8_9PEZI|nr:histone chaperone domain CHZ-domain-containing protein [Microdochium trichocladiopsis]KAH7040506.1 histone chaperone domain CHZ-domain-containing protein [Microdochium trichocladiopsis]